MKNLGLNEKITINKVENQEKILQIIQMYFVTRKEKSIIKKISYWTKILKDYVNKKKSLKKVKNRLIILIKENKERIKKINIYLNKKT